MSEYKGLLVEAVRILGLKKVLSETLRVAGTIDTNTIGHLTIHVNDGSVVKIVKTVEVK